MTIRKFYLWQIRYDRTDKPSPKHEIEGFSSGYFRSKAKAEEAAIKLANDPKRHATNIRVVRTEAYGGLF